MTLLKMFSLTNVSFLDEAIDIENCAYSNRWGVVCLVSKRLIWNLGIVCV